MEHPGSRPLDFHQLVGLAVRRLQVGAKFRRTGEVLLPRELAPDRPAAGDIAGKLANRTSRSHPPLLAVIDLLKLER